MVGAERIYGKPDTIGLWPNSGPVAQDGGDDQFRAWPS